MSLSVCMIAKNEENWIGACLESLKSVGDEFIVVDTGSTDKTKQIAENLGAKTYDFDWTGNFSEARNFSLEKATGDWILVIDPDERIAAQDLAAFRDLMKAEKASAYSFQTRNYSENTLASGFTPCRKEYPDLEKNHSGYFESGKVRLFRRTPEIRFVGSVHELVEPSLRGKKIVESNIPFHHYGSTPEEVDRKQKRSFYQAQGQKKVSEAPENWKAHFELGAECLTGGDAAGAVQSFERARRLSPDDPLILSNLGYAYMENAQFQEAEDCLKKCLDRDSKHHDGRLNLGVTYMRQKRFDEALQVFDELVQVHSESFLAFRNAGNCFAQKRDLQKAAACFQKALSLFPNFVQAKVDLGIVYFAGGRPDLAGPLLADALEKSPGEPRASAVLAEIRKSHQKS